MPNVWIFSNNREGFYGDSDWDTSTILKIKRYYFKKVSLIVPRLRKETMHYLESTVLDSGVLAKFQTTG